MNSDLELHRRSLEVLEQHVQHYDYEHFTSVCELDPAKDLIIALRDRLAQPEPDYKEALRVLSLALEEAPGRLTPKQRSVWEKSRDVLFSGGGWA